MTWVDKCSQKKGEHLLVAAHDINHVSDNQHLLYVYES